MGGSGKQNHPDPNPDPDLRPDGENGRPPRGKSAFRSDPTPRRCRQRQASISCANNPAGSNRTMSTRCISHAETPRRRGAKALSKSRPREHPVSVTREKAPEIPLLATGRICPGEDALALSRGGVDAVGLPSLTRVGPGRGRGVFQWLAHGGTSRNVCSPSSSGRVEPTRCATGFKPCSGWRDEPYIHHLTHGRRINTAWVRKHRGWFGRRP